MRTQHWDYEPPRTIPRRCNAAICVVSVLLAIGCQRSLSEQECDALLDHYTDAQIEQARPSASSRDRLELKHAAGAKAQLDPEFARCADEVSRAQFECAMAAQSADQIERCVL
jgi:hypothetical protein